MSLIGKKAPLFSADAVINGNEVVERFTIEQFNGKKFVVLFFYPFDFSPVCANELFAFQQKIAELEKRNVAFIACSVDSVYSHLAWLNTDAANNGIKGVTFPLISDFSKTISMNYDIIGGEFDYNDEDEIVFKGSPFSHRGLFLIDKMGIIRHYLINDIPFGRSVNEAIRMVDALRHFERSGEFLSADWQKGEKGIPSLELIPSSI